MTTFTLRQSYSASYNWFLSAQIDNDTFVDAIAWLNQTLGEDSMERLWSYSPSPAIHNGRWLYFVNKEDAIAFKLVWEKN